MTTEERNELVLQNEKLIWFTIRKYHFDFLGDREDLYQEGCIALMRAIDNYNKEEGELSTYAIKSIKNHLYRYVNENNLIRRPEYVATEQYRIDQYKKEHPNAGKEELEKVFGWEMVDRTLGSNNAVISFDVPVGDDEDTGETILLDFLEDSQTNVEKTVIRDMISSKVREFFKSLDLGDPQKQKLAERVIFEDYRGSLTKSEVLKLKKWYIGKVRTGKTIHKLADYFGLPQGIRRKDIEEYIFGTEFEKYK